MAYNYLGLVNDINHRVNEVPLTSANFANATGFYQTAKDSVNAAIRRLNQEDFEWPFNHITREDILTAGTLRYPLPDDVKTVDFDSFRIKRNETFGNKTQKLRPVPYEEYLDKGIDQEYNTSDTSIRSIPRLVAQSPSMEYVVYPAPKEDYDLVYEYYYLPVDLILHDDVPNVPQAFRYVLIDGAMFFVYMFREDEQTAALYEQRFQDGINNMRTLYINRYREVRDTRVGTSNALNSVMRIG